MACVSVVLVLLDKLVLVLVRKLVLVLACKLVWALGAALQPLDVMQVCPVLAHTAVLFFEMACFELEPWATSRPRTGLPGQRS